MNGLDYLIARCIMTLRAYFFQGIVCQKGGTFSWAEADQSLRGQGATQKRNHFPNKKTKISEKGKPSERMGRKATGPKAFRLWQPGRQYFGYSFKMRGERNNGK